MTSERENRRPVTQQQKYYLTEYVEEPGKYSVIGSSLVNDFFNGSKNVASTFEGDVIGVIADDLQEVYQAKIIKIADTRVTLVSEMETMIRKNMAVLDRGNKKRSIVKPKKFSPGDSSSETCFEEEEDNEKEGSSEDEPLSQLVLKRKNTQQPTEVEASAKKKKAEVALKVKRFDEDEERRKNERAMNLLKKSSVDQNKGVASLVTRADVQSSNQAFQQKLHDRTMEEYKNENSRLKKKVLVLQNYAADLKQELKEKNKMLLQGTDRYQNIEGLLKEIHQKVSMTDHPAAGGFGSGSVMFSSVQHEFYLKGTSNEYHKEDENVSDPLDITNMDEKLSSTRLLQTDDSSLETPAPLQVQVIPADPLAQGEDVRLADVDIDLAEVNIVPPLPLALPEPEPRYDQIEQPNKNGVCFTEKECHTLAMLEEMKYKSKHLPKDLFNYSEADPNNNIVRLVSKYDIFVHREHLERLLEDKTCKNSHLVFGCKLLPVVFKLKYLKYFSISGGKGKASGYECLNQQIVNWAPLPDCGKMAIQEYLRQRLSLDSSGEKFTLYVKKLKEALNRALCRRFRRKLSE